jgi:hypothetical protein
MPFTAIMRRRHVWSRCWCEVRCRFTDLSGLPWIGHTPALTTISLRPTETSTGSFNIILSATDLAQQRKSVAFWVIVQPLIADMYFNETLNETVIDYGLPPDALRASIGG